MSTKSRAWESTTKFMFYADNESRISVPDQKKTTKPNWQDFPRPYPKFYFISDAWFGRYLDSTGPITDQRIGNGPLIPTAELY